MSATRVEFNFEELHVVSDLHFGGEDASRQIFGSTAELKALIEQLAAADPERRIALAINGDFVDFLAESPGCYFDPSGAASKLARVMKDPAFKPVFDSLTKFVGTQNRTLIVNLGNHDLELALPWVAESFVRTICGVNAACRSRLHVIANGTGVPCRVGDASVLLAHGNEVDSWNVVDFERMRRIARDTQFGKLVEAWTPNAGTKMVIDVMNTIKQRYPFVDLLKPEVEAVVPTLLALDPRSLNELRGAAAIAGRRAFDAARMATGFLGDADVIAPVGVGSNMAYEPAPMAETQALNQAQAGVLMNRIEAEMKRGSVPLDLVRAQPDTQLGFWSAAWNVVTGRPTHEVLRAALDTLDADRSFDIHSEDATFRQLDELAGPDIDFVVAGHTHLERALRRKLGRGYYFNSGTWARLICIAPDVRQDPPGKIQHRRRAQKLGRGHATLLQENPPARLTGNFTGHASSGRKRPARDERAIGRRQDPARGLTRPLRG